MIDAVVGAATMPWHALNVRVTSGSFGPMGQQMGIADSKEPSFVETENGAHVL